MIFRQRRGEVELINVSIVVVGRYDRVSEMFWLQTKTKTKYELDCKRKCS